MVQLSELKAFTQVAKLNRFKYSHIEVDRCVCAQRQKNSQEAQTQCKTLKTRMSHSRKMESSRLPFNYSKQPLCRFTSLKFSG